MKNPKAFLIIFFMAISFSSFAQNSVSKTYQPLLLMAPADFTVFNAQEDAPPSFEWTAEEKVEVAYYIFKLYHSVWDEIIQREVTQIYTYQVKDTKMPWPADISFHAINGNSTLFLWEVFPVDISGRIITTDFNTANSFSVINPQNKNTYSMISSGKN